MALSIELDPRVKGFEKTMKLAAVAVVAVLASGIVIVGSLSVIATGGLVLGALVVVNFIPVAARCMALKKQAALTYLAETFSEETVREDERHEAERVAEAEAAFAITKSELEGAIEEMRSQIHGATPDEQNVINNQIRTMEGVITSEGEALRQRQVDLKELRRLNGLLIAIDRSARAMSKAQGAERNPEEHQRLMTARNAIKTRMRSAIAGQQVEAMRREVHGNSASAPTWVVPQVGHSPVRALDVPAINRKEKANVPNRR